MKKIFLFFCLSLIASMQVAFANRAEDGIATFYGDNFHGRKTSSNEIYDKDQLTAAHRSLPYGTIVRVTVIATGATVDVRINDRGPFVKGRIITVSKKAAEILNILKETDPMVKLEVVQKTAPNPAPQEVTQTTAPQAVPATTNTPAATTAPIAETKAIAPVAEKTTKTAPVAETKSAPTVEKTTKATEPKPAATENKKEVASRSLSNNTANQKEVNYVKEASKMAPGSLYKMQVLQMEEKGYGVQIAGYSDYEAVYNQLSILQENHFKGGMVFVDELNGKNFYKVILGPFFTKEEASSYSKSLRTKHGMKDAFVVDLSALNKKAQQAATTPAAALTPETAPKTNAKVITTNKK